MAVEPDAIPETALVGLIDRLNRTTRRKWAEKGILRKAPVGEGYREEDAVELAAFVQLIRADVGDFYETVAAWEGIRVSLGDAMSRDREAIAGDFLVAIIAADTKAGTLVTGHA
jgi:hypothetical protein